jgi:hypothetical protein
MWKVLGAWSIYLVFAWLAVACAAPPTAGGGGGQTLQYTQNDVDLACSSLIDTDYTEVYRSYTNPIYWEFFINFRTFAQGNNWGCLRLYGRHTDPGIGGGTFLPIDSNAVGSYGLPFPCVVIGTVKFAPTTPRQLASSKGAKRVDATQASFPGNNDYIVCDVDIAGAANAVDKNQFPAELNPQEVTEIENFIQNLQKDPVQHYDNFSIIALGANLDPNTGDNPIVYYEPIDDPCCQPVGLDMPAVPGQPVPNVINHAAHWGGTTFAPDPTKAQQQDCWFSADPLQYWWLDFGTLDPPKTAQKQYYLEFARRALFTTTVTYCADLTAPIPQAPLGFFVGPAKLYIGARPTTPHHPPKTFLHGQLFEVWVDPDRASKVTSVPLRSPASIDANGEISPTQKSSD